MDLQMDVCVRARHIESAKMMLRRLWLHIRSWATSCAVALLLFTWSSSRCIAKTTDNVM